MDNLGQSAARVMPSVRWPLLNKDLITEEIDG